MNRTSQALRRFGVPVLAATALLTGGQIALGTSAFAVTGSLAITPNPGYQTVTPSPPAAGPYTIQETVTYTPGIAGPQAIQIQVTGSAKIVAPTAPPAVTGAVSSISSDGKSATCTTDASNTCRFAVTDTVSEAVTVQAVDTTDGTTPPTTATDNFASLYWNHCSSAAQNTTTNCVTQATVGQATTYTVTYKTAGQPAAGITVTFTTNNAIVTSTQPAGTAFFDSFDAVGTTNAQGQASVTILDNTAHSGATADTISAITSNTGNYPQSEADTKVNMVASAVPGRLTPVGAATQLQPSSQTNGLNMPGDVVAQTFEVDACGANTNVNVCAQGTPLAGVSVAATIDHGFFTPACVGPTAAPTQSYANCTFNTTPAAGTKVGDIKSSGTSMTFTTDNNGQFTAYMSIGRDAAFDAGGIVNTTLTGVVNGVTLATTNPGNAAANTNCTTTPAAGGCPFATQWSTKGAPLNGGSLKINWITTPALSDTATNEIQIGSPNEQNVFVLSLTDQYGNLTTGGGNNVTLTATGSGELYSCVAVVGPPASPAYTSTNPCVNKGAAAFTQPSGTPTYTINNANGSYTAPFDAAGATAQSRFAVDSAGSIPTGTQTLKATWSAPVTTFSSFFAATSTTAAFATYDGTKTSTLSDTVTNDFYKPVATTTTFTTAPGNSVPAGTVVTVDTVVKDQHGAGIQNLSVQFIRSGPQTQNGTSCSATNVTQNTGNAGGAGFSFTCTNPSTQVVTIIVRDANGAEVARGTQTINFTGTTTTSKRTVFAHIVFCKSPSKHLLVCKVQVTPHIAGLQVTLRDGSGHFLGSQRTNHNGVVTIKHGRLKSHKRIHVHARVAGSATTKAATSNTVTVRIR